MACLLMLQMQRQLAQPPAAAVSICWYLTGCFCHVGSRLREEGHSPDVVELYACTLISRSGWLAFCCQASLQQVLLDPTSEATASSQPGCVVLLLVQRSAASQQLPQLLQQQQLLQAQRRPAQVQLQP